MLALHTRTTAVRLPRGPRMADDSYYELLMVLIRKIGAVLVELSEAQRLSCRQADQRRKPAMLANEDNATRACSITLSRCADVLSNGDTR